MVPQRCFRQMPTPFVSVLRTGFTIFRALAEQITRYSSGRRRYTGSRKRTTWLQSAPSRRGARWRQAGTSTTTTTTTTTITAPLFPCTAHSARSRSSGSLAFRSRRRSGGSASRRRTARRVSARSRSSVELAWGGDTRGRMTSVLRFLHPLRLEGRIPGVLGVAGVTKYLQVSRREAFLCNGIWQADRRA